MNTATHTKDRGIPHWYCVRRPSGCLNTGPSEDSQYPTRPGLAMRVKTGNFTVHRIQSTGGSMNRYMTT